VETVGQSGLPYSTVTGAVQPENGRGCGSPCSSTWRACNFGGDRPWFICPEAGYGRREAILYGPVRYFLCRDCYDLVYESKRESGTYQALHKAHAIRGRLGGSANIMELFPEKCKRAHRKTYERLWWEHHEAEMEQLAGMREWLDNSIRR
jgi:hypothetical protein